MFKLFGFKGSLLGRKKEGKEDKGEVICIGYRVNPEYLDSLPPPVLQSSQPTTSKAGATKSKDSERGKLVVDSDRGKLIDSEKGSKLITDSESGKPNGNIAQGLITKNQPNYTNSPKTEVVRERKPVVKPAAQDLFKPTPKGSSSSEDEKEKRKPDIAIKEEVNNTFSTAPRDSDSERKSTLIFLTENHDENETDNNRSSSNIYEEMDVNKFKEASSIDSSDSEINFVQTRSAVVEESPDGNIDFVQSNRFVSQEHDDNPDVYSSQASSLFFGEPEPETVNTKRKAPGRPSQADSETSA